MSNRKTILVTGGAGFIGSALVRLLIQNKDLRVVNVDALTYAGNLESLSEINNADNYCFEQVNICDAPALNDLFDKYEPAAVMHLAAESHVDRSIDGPAAFIDTNVLGTYNMLPLTIEGKRTPLKLFERLVEATEIIFHGYLGNALIKPWKLFEF